MLSLQQRLNSTNNTNRTIYYALKRYTIGERTQMDSISFLIRRRSGRRYFMAAKSSSNEKNGKAHAHGGARPGSGRKKSGRVQVTVALRRDTIAEFRKVGGRDWGEYLQAHLDRFPTDEGLLKRMGPRPKNPGPRPGKEMDAFMRKFAKSVRESDKQRAREAKLVAKNDDTRKTQSR